MPVTTLARATVAGVDLAEIEYSAGLHLPRHSHERAGFCLVLDGTYIEGYSTRNLNCRAHTVTFSPAGEEHRNVFGEGTVHCLTIDIPHAFLARLDEATLRAPFEERGGTLAMLAERLLFETRQSDDASPLAIEGLVLEMLAVAVRSERVHARVSPAIRHVRELLEARFAEPLELTDIAAAVERHPVYVATFPPRIRRDDWRMHPPVAHRLRPPDARGQRIADRRDCPQRRFCEPESLHQGVSPDDRDHARRLPWVNRGQSTLVQEKTRIRAAPNVAVCDPCSFFY